MIQVLFSAIERALMPTHGRKDYGQRRCSLSSSITRSSYLVPLASREGPCE